MQTQTPEVEKRRVAGVSPLSPGHRKKAPPRAGGFQIKGQITVNKPPQVAYNYWRDFKKLPLFLTHLQEVVRVDDVRSHWTVNGPADTTVEWDAEIIKDVPGRLISWRSTENAQIDNAGSVWFFSRAGQRQTEVKVVLTYNPLMGRLGDWLISLFGANPNLQLADNLNDFKRAVESGNTQSKR